MSHLVVVGDVLLDRDLTGRAERLCPDAPVPVLEVDHERCRPGGAGLAALLAARGRPGSSSAERPRVTLVCALGADPAAATLVDLLGAHGIEVVDLGEGGSTPEKIRLRADGQSLLRLDRGTGARCRAHDEHAADLIATADAVLVADYGHGVTSAPGLRRALVAARRRGVPVVWDPHPRGSSPVAGTTVATPNRAEAAAAAPQVGGVTLADDLRRAELLRSRWAVGAVAITRGADGAALSTGHGAPLVVPAATSLHGVDPCGAGDAFAVGVTLCLADGGLLSDAVGQGLRHAEEYLADGGTAALERTAPRSTRAHGSSPALEPTTGTGRTAKHATSPTRAATSPGPAHRPTVVATGGCFDVVHPGHLALLRAARSLGDRLVVLVNSDDSVRRLKGDDRPVHLQQDRVATLRSLRDVDEVVVFDEDTPERALQRLRPDVFVKGGDYTAADLPERRVLERWGGVAVTVPYLPGHSTTALLSGGPTDRDRRSAEEADHVG
jgi:rfaE bifunctional protein nucleotidyltransferase chain/domain/rfaE bifunctional protein kinase chain/domain